MTYLQLAYFHLATVLPAFFIATYLLINTKGTPRHRLLGKAYMVLMLVTALITLFMPAHIGPLFLDHFGLIHLFSLLVFYLIPNAILAIRTGDVVRHKSSMVGLYIGGLVVAGSFAFMPGRLLHTWLFT
ncbi:DUF2306 domain-containing protein [Marinomonas balearica]|uniref:Putative membrane protein n=1 Tax=Marinomonas balearica TaxID=491947 RepID=A0A4R6M910_9GAMM|nr:DUF2306 domain-containing protein [Marinomonas balearica]TDO97967.1 putative membrane protein [Marinomonas balearica]